jgi:serine/threonine-protein kinase
VQAGIVHRDFKPDNVILVSDHDGAGMTAKVIDFGIARASPTSAARILVDPTEGDATCSGRLVAGTPHYMAPEQTRGETIDAATDQWAFGVVVYECATGALPFDGAHSADVFQKIRRGHYVPPSRRATVPRALDEWMRALVLATAGAALLSGALIARHPSPPVVDAGAARGPETSSVVSPEPPRQATKLPPPCPATPTATIAPPLPRAIQAAISGRSPPDVPASYRVNPY